jgi:hypothetical protein
MCAQGTSNFDFETLKCRYTFRIATSEYQKKTAVKTMVEIAPGYELETIYRNFSLKSIASRMIEEITVRDQKDYVFRSLFKLLTDFAFRPSIWWRSLTRSFVISVNQIASDSAVSLTPILTQFRMHQSLDFWSRITASESSDDKSPHLNSLSIELVVRKALLKNPIIQLCNVDFRKFVDYLAVTHDFTVAKHLMGPLKNTLFIQALELIADRGSVIKLSGQLNQMMLKGSDSDLHPIHSHQQFNFDLVNTLENVEIWHERFVVQDNFIICRENAADLRADSPAGLWMYKWAHPTISTGVLVSKPITSDRTIEKAIAGFGRYDANWFHFIIETLPRILGSSEVTEKGVPVLVQTDIPQSAIDAIVATTGREVIKINGNFLHVKELVVAQAKSATMDSVFLDSINGDFTTTSIASVRESLLKAFPPGGNGNKRIVLLRQGSYRRIKNIEKVLSVLNEYGFESVDIGSLTLRDQINVVNNASVIVSQGGAGITNMLFANQGANFIGLIGPAKNQHLFWEAFLNVLMLRNSFIVGKHVGKKNRVQVHSDFLIPIKELRSTLQQL